MRNENRRIQSCSVEVYRIIYLNESCDKSNMNLAANLICLKTHW